MSDSANTSDVLKKFAPMIYGPTILFALGEGAVIPLLPVMATNMGADLAASSLVATALVLGQLCGNLPAGWAVAKFGERKTMLVASAFTLVGTIVLLTAFGIGFLMLAALVVGFSASAFALARHSFMTTRVPLHFRARALSLLGGSFRFGMFIGPFVAAGLLAIFNDEHAAVWFLVACVVGVVLLVTFGPDPEVEAPPLTRVAAARDDDAADTGELITTGSVPTAPAREGVFQTMWHYRGVLFRLGITASSLSALRSARQALMPLWGVSIGLDAQSIVLVVGIAGAIDFALFYASGQVMDRFGRLWAALPAMLLMTLSFLALSLTHDLPNSTMWFAAFAMVLGVGNGLSSGLLLTLGADTAPQNDPAPYLGSWRMLTDGGATVAPLLITAITAAASLPWAAASMAIIGVFGSLGFAKFIPRFVPRPPGRD